MSDSQNIGNSNMCAADRIVDCEPLIEALNNWEAMFELALDKAAVHLNSEEFPANDLQTSLCEMCDLLRAVLSRNVILYDSQS